MVYGFAKQSGGHIKIYSEIGEGTTIKLYFPRIAEQRDIPLWTGDERVAGRRALAGGGNETILLVEDEEEVQRFAAEVLRERGYKVHAATDAQSVTPVRMSTRRRYAAGSRFKFVRSSGSDMVVWRELLQVFVHVIGH